MSVVRPAATYRITALEKFPHPFWDGQFYERREVIDSFPFVGDAYQDARAKAWSRYHAIQKVKKAVRLELVRVTVDNLDPTEENMWDDTDNLMSA